jgi:hypothetical protein
MRAIADMKLDLTSVLASPDPVLADTPGGAASYASGKARVAGAEQNATRFPVASDSMGP